MNLRAVSVPLILAAILFSGSLRASDAATYQVTETYRFELFDFGFRSNFWQGSAGATDASSPVPVERMSMTFRIDYLTPVIAAAAYRGVAQVDFAFLDFEMEIGTIPGLSVAQSLTLSQLTSPRATVARGGDRATLRIGGTVIDGEVDHVFRAYLPDLELLARGSIGPGAWFIVDFGSLKGFDSPEYIVWGNRLDLVDGIRQRTWQSTLLSQTSTPAPIPLPGAGMMLAGALAGLGFAAKPRVRARNR